MLRHCVREWGGLQVDTRDWPIVLMEFPERRIENAELHAGLAFLESLMHEGQQIGEKSFQITDLTRMREFAFASQRKHAAEWVRRTLSLQRAASLGGANVTPSPIVRGLVTAISWLQPPATPTVFVATRVEAYREALKVFEAAGVELSGELAARIEAYQ